MRYAIELLPSFVRALRGARGVPCTNRLRNWHSTVSESTSETREKCDHIKCIMHGGHGRGAAMLRAARMCTVLSLRRYRDTIHREVHIMLPGSTSLPSGSRSHLCQHACRITEQLKLQKDVRLGRPAYSSALPGYKARSTQRTRRGIRRA